MPRWVGWRYELRSNSSGVSNWTKVPKQAQSPPYNAKANDPRTWSSFQQAWNAYRNPKNGLDGIGIIAEGSGLVGLDFDGCGDVAAGSNAPRFVRGLFKRFKSYTEFSPSGKGLRLLIKARPPEKGRKQFKMEKYGFKELELIWQFKFFTVTGHPVPGSPKTIVEGTEELHKLHSFLCDEVSKKSVGPSLPPAPRQTSSEPDEFPVDRIREALRFIDPDATYEQWLHVGQALHNSGNPTAFSLWDDWSRGGPKYAGASELRKKWDGFRAGVGISLGTLFQYAKDGGWLPKRSSSEHRKRSERAAQTSGSEPDEPESPYAGVTVHDGCLYEWNDHGLTVLFLDMYADRVRYDPRLDVWYMWGDGFDVSTGKVWRIVPEVKINGRVSKVIEDVLIPERDNLKRRMDALRKSASDDPGVEGELNSTIALHKALKSHVNNFRKRRGLENIVGLAKTYIENWGGHVETSAFDTDLWLLNVENGVLDLKTLELLPHDPSRLISKIAPVHWKGPSASAERWDRFVTDVTGIGRDGVPQDEAEALYSYLRQICGYLLFGGNPQKKLFMLKGPTNSGKTTLLNAIVSILGMHTNETPAYANTSDAKLFIDDGSRNPDAPSPSITALRGLRVTVASEPPHSGRLDGAKIKQMTGNDYMVGRDPHARESITFQPQFTPVIAMNEAPRIDRNDEALLQRIQMIPFPHTIPPERIDIKLGAVFDSDEDERAGILAWAVTGLQQYLQQGERLSDPPRSVVETFLAVQREQSRVREFLDDKCVLEQGGLEPADFFRQQYGEWCRKNEEKPLCAVWLGKDLATYGIRAMKKTYPGRGRIHCYVGVRLKTTDVQTEEPPASF